MFIDLDGISVNSKHIEAVESIDDLNCFVYTSSKTFTVSMPRRVVLSMIGMKDEHMKPESNVEKLLKQIYINQESHRL